MLRFIEDLQKNSSTRLESWRSMIFSIYRRYTRRSTITFELIGKSKRRILWLENSKRRSFDLSKICRRRSKAILLIRFLEIWRRRSFNLSKVYRRRWTNSSIGKLKIHDSFDLSKILSKDDWLENRRSGFFDLSKLYKTQFLNSIGKSNWTLDPFFNFSKKSQRSTIPSIYKKSTENDPFRSIRFSERGLILLRFIEQLKKSSRYLRFRCFPPPTLGDSIHDRVDPALVNPTMIKQIDNVRTLIKTGRLSDIFDYPRI